MIDACKERFMTWVDQKAGGAMFEEVVIAEVHDAALLQVAALREELALSKHDVASFLETTAKVCELLGIDTDDAKHAEGKPSDVLFSHAPDLRQRLTAAEQRNAELEKNAARYVWLRDESESVHQLYLSTPIWFTGVKFNKENVDATIDASMAKPTESGASE